GTSAWRPGPGPPGRSRARPRARRGRRAVGNAERVARVVFSTEFGGVRLAGTGIAGSFVDDRTAHPWTDRPPAGRPMPRRRAGDCPVPVRVRGNAHGERVQ